MPGFARNNFTSGAGCSGGDLGAKALSACPWPARRQQAAAFSSAAFGLAGFSLLGFSSVSPAGFSAGVVSQEMPGK